MRNLIDRIEVADNSLTDMKAEINRMERLGSRLAYVVSNTLDRYHAHEQGPARETLRQWDERAYFEKHKEPAA